MTPATITAATADATSAAIVARLHSSDYRDWRAKVEASGGCAHPVRLRGSSTILDRDGEILAERAGEIFAPCGNRRESVCPACSDRYAGDAFHLIRAGLTGGDKGIPEAVAGKLRLFLTLTAPSFGPVHTRRLSVRGRVIPCGCGAHHREHDPVLGTALDPYTYDYEGAVLWQAHAGQLWHRFAVTLRRNLAVRLSVPMRRFRDVARLSYAKVAEYQRRGLVHFHAAIRVDGPDPPTPHPPGSPSTHCATPSSTPPARSASRSPDRTPPR